MKLDIGEEVETLRRWYASATIGQPAADPLTEATMAGFLWALSSVSGESVEVLRARVLPPRDSWSPPSSTVPSVVTVSPVAVPPADPVGTPPWAGLGMTRISRSRECDPSEPLGAARAFTAGPDGRPMRSTASYAELACDLSGDTETPVEGVDVPSSTTS